MFFFLSKIFSLILYPLLITIILIIASLFWAKKKPRVSRTLAISALLILWVGSTEWFSSLLSAPLESRIPRSTQLEGIDAIVVLSGMTDLKLSGKGKVELEEAADRIFHGILLARRFPQSRLIISGGSGSAMDQEASEAHLLSKYFVPEFGIPIERILTDGTSRNTFENAANTSKILNKHGLKRPVLITSASHMPRALACFRKQGIEPFPYPVDFISRLGRLNIASFLPKASSLAVTNRAIHEYVGLLAYRIMGYI